MIPGAVSAINVPAVVSGVEAEISDIVFEFFPGAPRLPDAI